jgi:hypothetical protein
MEAYPFIFINPLGQLRNHEHAVGTKARQGAVVMDRVLLQEAANV